MQYQSRAEHSSCRTRMQSKYFAKYSDFQVLDPFKHLRMAVAVAVAASALADPAKRFRLVICVRVCVLWCSVLLFDIRIAYYLQYIVCEMSYDIWLMRKHVKLANTRNAIHNQPKHTHTHTQKLRNTHTSRVDIKDEKLKECAVDK